MNLISIRDAQISDAERILEIYSYYIINTAITFEYEIPSIEDFRNRMTNTLSKYPYLVIEVDGEVMGYAYAGAFKTRAAYDWAAELSIYLDKDAQKMGLGRKLYDAITKRLMQMGIVNLYACITYPNEPDEYSSTNSAEFHEHLGFSLCGTFHNCGYKFGRWYNMIWMEKIIGEHLPDMMPIKKYTEL